MFKIKGVIRSYIAQGNFNDAKTQMEFLKATFRDVDKTTVSLLILRVLQLSF